MPMSMRTACVLYQDGVFLRQILQVWYGLLFVLAIIVPQTIFIHQLVVQML